MKGFSKYAMNYISCIYIITIQTNNNIFKLDVIVIRSIYCRYLTRYLTLQIAVPACAK